MARYTGPTFKKSRRYGFSILENGKEFAKGKQREYVPGQHGPTARIKLSEYGLHLNEKQKVKFMYGVSEKQMKRTFEQAFKRKGVTGTNFLQLLETRMDNVVYRLGFATTRRQARQLVNHNHFLLNGKKADIPSIQIKVGDKIELRSKSQSNVQIKDSMKARPNAPWTKRTGFVGTLERLPERSELNKDINEALVVEYYSK